MTKSKILHFGLTFVKNDVLPYRRTSFSATDLSFYTNSDLGQDFTDGFRNDQSCIQFPSHSRFVDQNHPVTPVIVDKSRRRPNV